MSNPTDRDNQPRLVLAHGGGGRLTRDLVRDCFLPHLNDPELARLTDSALLDLPSARLAFTTDSFVVKPLFFRGGDIGKLAVCGTVNDLLAAGAQPLFLSLAVIAEEGLPLDVLTKVARSVADAARQARVRVVCADTKVVEKGSADQLFLTTSGIGILPDSPPPGPHRIVAGDAVIVSGTLGDHAIAVMSAREGLGFETIVTSDAAPLTELVAAALAAGQVHVMRDPTRGGLATVLNELARDARLGIELDETALPVHPAVRTACDMLGLDPLQAANEGKMVIVCSPDSASRILDALRRAPYGSDAALVGRVDSTCPGSVRLRTRIGGTRIVDEPVGELLPRIC